MGLHVLFIAKGDGNPIRCTMVAMHVRQYSMNVRLTFISRCRVLFPLATWEAAQTQKNVDEEEEDPKEALPLSLVAATRTHCGQIAGRKRAMLDA